MTAPLPLHIGMVLTRKEIHQQFGGSKQSYLPTKDGTVVCGCFDPDMNKRAPREIDLGQGPIVEATAQKLADAHLIIPVFLKVATNHWCYAGRFKEVAFSRSAEDLHAYPDRRSDAVGVLFLEEVESPLADPLPPDSDDYFAIEGKVLLRHHLARERSPFLAALKKREAMRSCGVLACEACGLNSKELPEGIGEAAFEVHHRLPLSETGVETRTRISDLALLCANCHRMIHRTQPLQPVERFSQMRCARREDA